MRFYAHVDDNSLNTPLGQKRSSAKGYKPMGKSQYMSSISCMFFVYVM
jgi:hypothetical protein